MLVFRERGPPFRGGGAHHLRWPVTAAAPYAVLMFRRLIVFSYAYKVSSSDGAIIKTRLSSACVGQLSNRSFGFPTTFNTSETGVNVFERLNGALDVFCDMQAIVLEGKYWKRRLESVTAEYKKWRRFYMERALYAMTNEDKLCMEEVRRFRHVNCRWIYTG